MHGSSPKVSLHVLFAKIINANLKFIYNKMLLIIADFKLFKLHNRIFHLFVAIFRTNCICFGTGVLLLKLVLIFSDFSSRLLTKEKAL